MVQGQIQLHRSYLGNGVTILDGKKSLKFLDFSFFFLRKGKLQNFFG